MQYCSTSIYNAFMNFVDYQWLWVKWYIFPKCVKAGEGKLTDQSFCSTTCCSSGENAVEVYSLTSQFGNQWLSQTYKAWNPKYLWCRVMTMLKFFSGFHSTKRLLTLSTYHILDCMSRAAAIFQVLYNSIYVHGCMFAMWHVYIVQSLLLFSH